jgi:flagellar basal body L-ring protein FlgH
MFAWIALSASLSACSGFALKSEEPTDYNAITNGMDDGNGRSLGGAWRSRAPEIPEASFQHPYGGGARSPASQASDDLGAARMESNEERLDPSDEGVRARIESNRGYSRQNRTFALGDRATRNDFYDNAPGDGSLWANGNDANHFFTKGKVRAPGDIVSVKVDEVFVRQIAEEVKKTLTPAEQAVEMALHLKNNELAKDDQDLKAYRNVASDDLRSDEAQAVKSRMEKAVRWSQVDLSKAIALNPNEELRAEIIDRFQNGNFKIRAMKRVLYRGHTKMVSLVAVAPAADLDDKDMIQSGKLYEYNIRVAR